MQRYLNIEFCLRQICVESLTKTIRETNRIFGKLYHPCTQICRMQIIRFVSVALVANVTKSANDNDNDYVFCLFNLVSSIHFYFLDFCVMSFDENFVQRYPLIFCNRTLIPYYLKCKFKNLKKFRHSFCDTWNISNVLFLKKFFLKTLFQFMNDFWSFQPCVNLIVIVDMRYFHYFLKVFLILIDLALLCFQKCYNNFKTIFTDCQ